MTLVAVWLEEDTLWAVGDTQISAVEGATVLTEAGTKIFPLSVEYALFERLGEAPDLTDLLYQRG